MPFTRPTIQQIYARVKADIQGSLQSTAAFYRRSFERGASWAMTGVANLLHGHLDWIGRQIDPSTADEDVLENVHGTPNGVYRKQAVAAQLALSATGGTPGAVLLAGKQYQRSDGTVFTVNVNATVSGGGALSAVVTAVVPGAAANTDHAEIFSLASPVVGIPSTATVVSATVVGADLETSQDYLARVLQKLRTPPKGGGIGDYAGWALEVAGITRAWEYPRKEGAGTVTVYMVNDDGSPITLLTAQITAVAAYMNQAGRQPTTADARLYTPTLYPVTFSASLSPNTADVRAAAETEIDAMLLRVGNPGGMTVLISQLNEAISIAPGENDHDILTLTDNIEIPFGSLPVRGVITWSTL